MRKIEQFVAHALLLAPALSSSGADVLPAKPASVCDSWLGVDLEAGLASGIHYRYDQDGTILSDLCGAKDDARYRAHRERLLATCGEACDLRVDRRVPGVDAFNRAQTTGARKDIDCASAWAVDADAEAPEPVWPPPTLPPCAMLGDFTMNGTAAVRWNFIPERGLADGAAPGMDPLITGTLTPEGITVWSAAMIDRLVGLARAGTLFETHFKGKAYEGGVDTMALLAADIAVPPDFTAATLGGVDMSVSVVTSGSVASGGGGAGGERGPRPARVPRTMVSGRSVLVIGSTTPWVEAVVLAAGASHVTTLEYRPILSEHPNVTATTMAAMRAEYLASAGLRPRFGAVVSHSSLEHSGLGRYGDVLNPWGDLMTMARVGCVVEDTALMAFAVPHTQTPDLDDLADGGGRSGGGSGGSGGGRVASGDGDEFVYNCHRVYGRRRYPHLVANWRLLWEGAPDCQRLRVFERMPPLRTLLAGAPEGVGASASVPATRVPSWDAPSPRVTRLDVTVRNDGATAALATRVGVDDIAAAASLGDHGLQNEAG